MRLREHGYEGALQCFHSALHDTQVHLKANSEEQNLIVQKVQRVLIHRDEEMRTLDIG